MSTAKFSHPRLHALIGDAAFDVPADIAREMESALVERNHPAGRPAFFACLDAIHKGDCADGQPWNPAQSPKVSALDMASLSRSLGGLVVLLDVLHAAERCRLEGDEDEQLGEFVIDGLIASARQLAQSAQHSLGAAVPA